MYKKFTSTSGNEKLKIFQTRPGADKKALWSIYRGSNLVQGGLGHQFGVNTESGQWYMAGLMAKDPNNPYVQKALLDTSAVIPLVAILPATDYTSVGPGKIASGRALVHNAAQIAFTTCARDCKVETKQFNMLDPDSGVYTVYTNLNGVSTFLPEDYATNVLFQLVLDDVTSNLNLLMHLYLGYRAAGKPSLTDQRLIDVFNKLEYYIQNY
jgi:hypothetical protein